MTLQKILTTVADDLQSGSTISGALSKHPKAFSGFYVSMVKSGEESGKLDETFLFLADYLDRTYELITKARGALVYPSFIILTFVAVMVLMFTMVIPKISAILVESGQEVPFYTKIVLGISNSLLKYGFVLLAIIVIGGFFLIRFIRTPPGKAILDRVKISIPYLSTLFRKLYLSRIADNMNTMLISGIPMIRAL